MILLLLFWLVAIAPLSDAAENSSPAALQFHFDASAQANARRDAGFPSIGHSQAVDFVLDTSARHRLASQPSPTHRPIFVSDGSSSYWLFDGTDDFLALDIRPFACESLTVFVLAAPKGNPGNFSALFGAAGLARNDYQSGINVDFGPQSTKDISVLNVEGAGSVGFRDLLVPGFFNATDRPFGDFHVFTVRTAPGKTETFLDGFKGGEREREPSTLALDQAVFGARWYSNDPSQPPFAQGFFQGAIAGIMVYAGALDDAARSAIEHTLLEKTVGLNALLRGEKGHALQPVKDPPVVQMLVPGFSVHELPLRIGNLNNLRYRPDGKVAALGYDGRIYLLSDSDGDGLEDRADIFWDKSTIRAPIGMALTLRDDPRGEGVFVASKGKISLILDRDRDGHADEEIIVASGWPEPFHNVDTLGLAVDPADGSIYFGFGCANFVDAYQIDRATGKSAYRLDDFRGTIQRVSPDFKTRETICTGVRFTCGLAFNHHGDLFATDQEGATWLPNGNPLDELLHIERGKHYGFPPRHPRHLPDVRDQPAVMEYGPQHQSTVGLVFNEGVNGGPSFGPSNWEHDALICGESRGKLYRTKLVKTSHGYVGQNQLIATLGMLTVDACVSPLGDLLVACHSGPPDWGSGPAGEGRLFRIRYSRPELPQPVLAWAASPDEFRVAFDRPLAVSDWARAKEDLRIEAGSHVAAGDRFESIRPGYQIVRDQMNSPRRWIEVLSLNLTEDLRTLVLRVPRQTEPGTYAVTLPTPTSWISQGGIPQHPQIDLALTLQGIEARVTNGNSEISVVLPHPSLEVSAPFTQGSSDHERFFKAGARPGAAIALRGAVDLSNPFVPTVQPGSKLDWDPSKDAFASHHFSLFSSASPIPVAPTSTNQFEDFATALHPTSGASSAEFILADRDLSVPVSLSRLRPSWVTGHSAQATNQIAESRSDVHGNWLRGRRVFAQDGGCATCHTVRGAGTPFGPDLSNLIHRDRASVIQDILRPSATINPDHAGSTVTLDDGTELAGIVRALDDQYLVLGLPGNAQLHWPRPSIRKIEPLKTSLMPAGIDQQLSAEQFEDLLTYLLVDVLQPASFSRADPPAPPARTFQEIEPFLPPSREVDHSLPKLKILLCSGPKDHGTDEHDYPLWLERWSRLLRLAENVSVATSVGFPSAAQLETTDVAVFFNANPDWDAAKAALLDAYHERGGGAVYLHYAVDGGKDPGGVAERMGLAFTLGSRFRHGEFDLVFTQQDHPITRGLPTLHLVDETYWNMRGDLSRLTILGNSVEDGVPRPQLWTLNRKKGRVVGCIPGHYTWTFDDPLVRILMFRAICWAARQENSDRLAELSTIGARIQ